MARSLRFSKTKNIAPVQRDRFARGTRMFAALAVTALAACGGDGGGVVGPSSTGGAAAPGGMGASPSSSPNPFAGRTLYVNPNSNARKTANEWRATRPADADQMEKIAARSNARWFNEWAGDVYAAVTGAMTAAESQGALPVLVAYNIPDRDCGGLSGGGGATPDGYRTWITAFANAIAGRKAAVILEPDALANMSCLSPSAQQTRLDLIKYAIQALKGKGAAVYVDAGHPAWHSASEMARRLNLADVGSADGFALNVSNFIATATNTSYGEQVSALVGGKHFVIDTGRNGLGATADLQWCNPPGRALGQAPTAVTANALIDAYLWIKPPGESDGACNGAPSAGKWWPEYALELAKSSP
ncbi:MAG TPA: glycoside hydrolase family 6 protein [Gemmatimonadaceae bacterium]|nr:glycoside hydrolase family 6 protein [Gemmatimonadaceae bacterium]